MTWNPDLGPAWLLALPLEDLCVPCVREFGRMIREWAPAVDGGPDGE